MSNFKHKIKLSFFASAFLLSNCVLADEIDESHDLGETVISASGYEQEIKQAPASISIITSDEIMNRPIRDLGDIVQEVPGVSTSVSKTGSQNIQMRGLSSSYTLILVDGKRVNMSKGFDGNGFDATSGFLPPPSMIERVEVIRGPASLIYGSDAMGGVINIITKKQADKATGSIGIETRLQESANWGNIYGLHFNTFAPLDEQLSINFRGKYNFGEANHFYRSDYGAPPSANGNPYTSHSPTGFKNYSFGYRLNYKFDDANNFYFDVDYAFQRFGSLNTSRNSVTSVRDHNRWQFVLNHDGNYDFGIVNNYFQYFNSNRVPHTDVPIGGNTGKPSRVGLVENQFFAYGTTFKTNFEFSDTSSLMLNMGPYFSWEKLMNRSDGIDPDMYQVAVFGEAEYFLNEYFSTTAGLRVNQVQTYGTNLSPRLYFNLYPTEWLTFKAGVANGFQAPNLTARFDNESVTTDEITYGNPYLKPETTWNYEVGTILETPLANFSVTGFYTDFKDAIKTNSYNSGVAVPGHGSCGYSSCVTYSNVDSARSSGVEVGIKSKALLTNFIPRGIFIDINYAFTETEQLSGANKGKPLNDIPRHNASAKLSYKGQSFDTYLRWVGKMKTTTANTHRASASSGPYFEDTHVVDLGANYTFKNGITVGAMINNLFNTNFTSYELVNTTLNQRYQRILPSRNYWLTVRADF
ncbi:TonB-dependent receptor [uncultured Campylobacter sp.]|uniref:TonB-dependent receptor domain-containing protein n=1 Tax=uncultured Campylobacter sp. TaxID=218934 RepID=UPI002627B97E|nr:TonB-dependent receptor [uncultured Campylobacter sp.]